MITKTDKNRHYINNALHFKGVARMQRYDAAVHVEAEADVDFWKNIFSRYLPQKNFYFISYSKTDSGKKATGCSTCLKYKNLGCLSKDFFVCIDSDYHYLLEEKDICIENFTFQTYTYSIENHWCYSEKISKVFEKAGLQNTVFDFDVFLQRYSETLYGLFIYHLHSLSLRDSFFPKKEFKKYLAIPNINLDPNVMINSIKANISTKMRELKNHYTTMDINKLKNKYEGLGVKKENAYLYFRGHNIFEQVILKIAKTVQRELQRLQQANYIFGKEKGMYYQSNIHKIESYFQEDLYFEKYDEIRKIEKDIEKYSNTI